MREHARIVVITGQGRGKTTSALGTMLRGLAHGKRTLLARFAKSAPSGELDILASLPGLTILTGERGMASVFGGDFDAISDEARALFEKTTAMAGEYDALVLDEICGVAALDMVGEEEVVAFVNGLRPDQSVILTGRWAGKGIVEAADTVSEINSIKHAYEKGMPAEKGIEY